MKLFNFTVEEELVLKEPTLDDLLDKARNDVEAKRSVFDCINPEDTDLVDAAIYELTAAENKYNALIRQKRKEVREAS